MSALPQLPLPEFGLGGVLRTLFDTSDTGWAQLRPVYAAGQPEEPLDFAYEQPNPAARRLLGLPAQALASRSAAELAFFREAFLSDKASYHTLTGLHVAARRVGPVLLASFTHRASGEPAASGEAGVGPLAGAAQQAAWARLLEQAPVAIMVLRGTRFLLELASPAMYAFWNRPREQVLGQPLFEALPEAIGSILEQLLTTALATGEPQLAYELPSWLARPERAEWAYLNFICQPLPNAQGQIMGLVVIFNDVSEQVRNRLHTQDLNAQLQATNEELRTNNEALALAQQQLRQLNQELECRVATGVREAQAAHAEAERQRQRLARFFQQAPAAIYVLDGPELVYELVNPGYQRFFPGRELVGRPLREATPELAEQPTYQWAREVYETGRPHEGHEVRLLLPSAGDGTLQEHYFNCVYHARHDEQGRTDGVLVFALDVTTQVLAQQRVEALQAETQAAAARHAQERETSYQVFEQTPAAVALMRGPLHQFEYANPAFKQLFGGRELRHLTLAEVLPPAVAQSFLTLLDQVYRTGETFVGTEIEFGPAYFNLTYQAYREAGAIRGVSVFCYEVTEQVLARRQREAHRRELEQLFMQAPTPIVVLDGPAHVFQLVNAAYQGLFPGRTLAGRPLLEALPELTDSPIPAICQRVYYTGELYQAYEMPLRLARHEGGPPEETFWTLTYQPRYNEQGGIDGIWVFAHEVTEQVRTQQAVQENTQQALALAHDLRATNEQLRRTNVDLDNFIYTASHDLKAPIANIEGLLLLLRQQLPPAAQQAALVPRVLDMMQGAIERFQLTIAQLTDLAKLQQAHTQPAEEVNLPDLVEAVRLDLVPLLEEAHAELRINLDSCQTISFAPQHLRSIIYNLLTNAIKYRHPDRPLAVALRCHALPGTIALEVQDNGLGLTPEQQGKLFGMFRRLHDHVPGSGVGLYMVKRIVENAGGTITVHSQADQGSTFSISLPNLSVPS